MTDQTPPDQRLSQYCEKHALRYMHFLPHCPVCRGEMLAAMPGMLPLMVPVERIPNKRGSQWDGAAMKTEEITKAQRPTRPVQMSLFD